MNSREAGDLVLRRGPSGSAVCRVPSFSTRSTRALLAIDGEPAGAGGEDGRLLGLRRVGEEHIAPAAARRRVADVENAVGEVLEEDTRLDLVLRARVMTP